MGETGNRILMAVLVGAVLIYTVRFFATDAHILFHTAEYEEIDIDDPIGDNGPKGPADICPMLAGADISIGETIAKANCTSCHNFVSETHGTGPHLVGIVGRDIASEDFSYSSALQGLPGDWTYAELNEFLYSPGAYVPGTKMNFAGWDNSKTKLRANVVAYLYAQSGAELPTCPAVEDVVEEEAAS